MATNFKENDIVTHINMEALANAHPELSIRANDPLYGIVKDAYKDKVFVEFLKKNNKTLNIVAIPNEDLHLEGNLFDLIKKGLTPIQIKTVVVKEKVAKETGETVVKEKKERKPREKKALPVTTETSGKLNGLRILPTGLFDHFNRGSFVDSIVNNGGIYGSGGVNKKLDILVVGRAAGPAKLDRAKELGIRMISEDEYIAMIS